MDLRDLRHLDKHHRIIVAPNIRKALGIDQTTILNIEVKNGAIVIQPVEVVVKKFKGQ